MEVRAQESTRIGSRASRPADASQRNKSTWGIVTCADLFCLCVLCSSFQQSATLGKLPKLPRHFSLLPTVDTACLLPSTASSWSLALSMTGPSFRHE